MNKSIIAAAVVRERRRSRTSGGTADPRIGREASDMTIKKLSSIGAAIILCLAPVFGVCQQITITFDGTQVFASSGPGAINYTAGPVSFNGGLNTDWTVGNVRLVTPGPPVVLADTSFTSPLTILVTETGLTPPAVGTSPGLEFHVGMSAFGANATTTNSLYFDPTNSGLDTFFLGQTSSADGSFNTEWNGNYNVTFPTSIYPSVPATYSLTDVIVVNTPGPSAQYTTSLNVQTTAIPEPETLSMLGLGLIGMGILRLRKTAA